MRFPEVSLVCGRHMFAESFTIIFIVCFHVVEFIFSPNMSEVL